MLFNQKNRRLILENCSVPVRAEACPAACGTEQAGWLGSQTGELLVGSRLSHVGSPDHMILCGRGGLSRSKPRLQFQ